MHLARSFAVIRWIALLEGLAVLQLLAPCCQASFLSASIKNDDELGIQDAASIVQVYRNVTNTQPDFLQESSPHYRMVAFHADDDTCSTCNASAADANDSSFLADYAILAQRLLQHTTLLHIHSISCNEHPALCPTADITPPTIRLYAPHRKNGGTPIDGPHLHPYKILATLGVLPDTSMARPFLNDQTYFGGNDGDAEQDGDFLRELEQVYTTKRGFLAHDMHFCLEQWLRHFVVTNHTTLALLGNERRRRLRPAVVDTLRDFLQLLRTVLTEVPGGSRLGPLVTEVRNNLGYVTRDIEGDYLRNILDEHTVRDWSAVCQSTQDGGSSYFCGLWKLLFRLAIGVREYTEAAVRPVTMPTIPSVVRRLQTDLGLLCATQDTECLELVTEATGKTDNLDKMSYEAQVLWLAELRQTMQRFLRKRQKTMLKLPYYEEDDVVTQWPLRSNCPRCWMEDGETRNLPITYAFIELEYGRAVLWKDVLPTYDIVYPEDEGTEYDDEEDGQAALSS